MKSAIIPGTISERLRALAAVRETEDPFLTVYLDTSGKTHSTAKELQLFLKNEARVALGLIHDRRSRASFEADIERIRAFIDAEVHVERKAHGQAIFACHGAGYFEVVHARRPFRNELLVGSRPSLRQLATRADEHAPVLCVVIDSRSARIYEISLGEAPKETDVAGAAPLERRPPAFKGYGDLRYQNRRRGQLEEHCREVASEVERRMAASGFDRVCVLGQDAVVAAFRKVASRAVEAAIVGSGPIDTHRGPSAILARVAEIAREEEHRQGERLVEQIRSRTLSGNLAAYGVPAVLGALRHANVYQLCVLADFRMPGWCCAACGALFSVAQRSDLCGYCEGPARPVELSDEIVRQAIEQGAEVETLERSDELEAMGRVGALLRYRD